jgi:hypothetical protein
MDGYGYTHVFFFYLFFIVSRPMAYLFRPKVSATQAHSCFEIALIF